MADVRTCEVGTTLGSISLEAERLAMSIFFFKKKKSTFFRAYFFVVVKLKTTNLTHVKISRFGMDRRLITVTLYTRIYEESAT